LTILIIILAIALQIFLTIKKISPFISLLIVAILAGLFLGMEPQALLKTIEKGVGSTLGGGGLALIICFGAILGKILEVSGAAEQISVTLINSFGLKQIQWAMMLTGFLIGIPLYYNTGFIILVPLVFSIAQRTKLPLLYIAIPMAAALSTTHCFLPPHPGPTTIVAVFEKQDLMGQMKGDLLGRVLMYGLIIAIPVAILAGPVLGRLLQNIKANIPAMFVVDEKALPKKLPPVVPSFVIALLPVFLITLAVMASNFMKEESLLKTIILFIGNSTIALLIAVLIATWYFGARQGRTTETITKWLSDAVAGIAIILLIITAGGVFKEVLLDSGTATYISSLSKEWQMPPLVFAWVVTALIRVAVGSASVASITAAGIVSPLLATSNVSPELMALAVGTGSVFGSHVNDSGFWLFKEFFGLSLKQTFLSWSLMETTISILGLIGVLILQFIIG
jgi:Gnt-I system high-affinity gluconate transporter